MNKKRDKKKFTRQNIRLRNLAADDLDAFYVEDIHEEKRASKKEVERAHKTLKSDIELARGRVLEVLSNHMAMVELDGVSQQCIIGGRLKNLNFETRSLLFAGDWVSVDRSMEEPRIEEILPRENSLSRFSEDGFQKEIVVAANIDQVVVTCSWAQPELRLGLLDRYLCSAEISEIEPVICVNKIDLAESEDEAREAFAYYEQSGYPVFYTSVKEGIGIEALRKRMIGKQTVFSGHSGVGKTSLINSLHPTYSAEVSHISESTGKGRHTTTRTCLIPFEFGGYLVDTPGIKTFGLHRSDQEELPRVFPGFTRYAAGCRFNDCTHTHETQCGVLDALERGEIPRERYESYLRIMESL